MSIPFSDTTTNLGIVQQVRNFMRVDSTQWPTSRIVNSINNYHDTVTGYAIGADKRFQWDDTNHTKLPIGTTNLVSGQSDYSFLLDEQNNPIITLTRIDIINNDGVTYRQLELFDQSETDEALQQLYTGNAQSEYYDKIADNIIRLYPTPSVSITAGIKFYFQRTGSYFAATDTTKSPGVSPLLHRGYVIAAAYDGALTLGLSNLASLGTERQIEERKMIQYFADRNMDSNSVMRGRYINPR